jgi:molybdate transport system substrate-binding protein
MGNPKTVPAGRYAEEVLSFYKIVPYIKDKRIYAENVRQILDYVARGEVDAGIVYATDAQMRDKDVIMAATAPDESHQPVSYPVAVVKGTRAEASAKKFVEMLRSEKAKQILIKYGFSIPK